METIAIVLALILAFGVANLGEQLAAAGMARQVRPAGGAPIAPAPEDPSHAQMSGISRTRTERRDLRLGIGEDFAGPDAGQQVWPKG